MSTKSKKSSKAKKASKAVDRPFAPAILKKARSIVAAYRLILEPDGDLGFIGHALEMPNVFADGKTADKCVKATHEALTGVVAFMLEEGRKPPMPSSAGKRTSQINIRISDEEKLLLEETARQEGYRGVSDYVRAVAIADINRRSA